MMIFKVRSTPNRSVALCSGFFLQLRCHSGGWEQQSRTQPLKPPLPQPGPVQPPQAASGSAAPWRGAIARGARSYRERRAARAGRRGGAERREGRWGRPRPPAAPAPAELNMEPGPGEEPRASTSSATAASQEPGAEEVPLRSGGTPRVVQLGCSPPPAAAARPAPPRP